MGEPSNDACINTDHDLYYQDRFSVTKAYQDLQALTINLHRAVLFALPYIANGIHDQFNFLNTKKRVEVIQYFDNLRGLPIRELQIILCLFSQTLCKKSSQNWWFKWVIVFPNPSRSLYNSTIIAVAKCEWDIWGLSLLSDSIKWEQFSPFCSIILQTTHPDITPEWSYDICDHFHNILILIRIVCEPTRLPDCYNINAHIPARNVLISFFNLQ